MVAVAVLVWMVGQVIGGVFAMPADMVSSFPSGPGPGVGSASSGFAP
jgi:hypothetical protein